MSNYLGFGRHTTGGSDGEIKAITALADSGPGSLRDIVTSSHEPTIILPGIDGVIRLYSPIWFGPDITLDLMDRVVINNYGFVVTTGNNIFERTRFFDVQGPDDSIRIGLPEAPPVENVVVNRCAFSNPNHSILPQEPDEYISVIYGARGITISNCRFTEGDKVLLIGNGDAPAEVDSEITVTIHDCLFKNTGRRHPYMRYGKVDMFRNTFDNWRIIDSRETTPQSFGARVKHGGQLLLEDNAFIQDSFFKKGWLSAIIHDGGYYDCARAEDTAIIQAVNNRKNRWWMRIENNGTVFERPYPMN